MFWLKKLATILQLMRYQKVQYDVVFRDKTALLKMYPPSKAMSRFKSACGQVGSMIRSKVKKGNLNDILKISNIWEQEVWEGKVKLLPFNEFKELAQLNPTGFTRLNLVLNPDSESTTAQFMIIL